MRIVLSSTVTRTTISATSKIIDLIDEK